MSLNTQFWLVVRQWTCILGLHNKRFFLKYWKTSRKMSSEMQLHTLSMLSARLLRQWMSSMLWSDKARPCTASEAKSECSASYQSVLFRTTKSLVSTRHGTGQNVYVSKTYLEVFCSFQGCCFRKKTVYSYSTWLFCNAVREVKTWYKHVVYNCGLNELVATVANCTWRYKVWFFERVVLSPVSLAYEVEYANSLYTTVL